MFYKAMPAVPIDDLPARQAELRATLHETPIILTHQGQGAGVLVHPQVWNELIEKLERYQEIIESLELNEQRILDAQVTAIDEAAGAWSDERHPELQTPEDVAQWLKALRSARSNHDISTNGAVINHQPATQPQITPEHAQSIS